MIINCTYFVLCITLDSSLQNRIDEFCIIFDIFSTQYSQLVSNNTEDMNLIDIFKQIQPILLEYNQLKTLIDPLDFDKVDKPKSLNQLIEFLFISLVI